MLRSECSKSYGCRRRRKQSYPSRHSPCRPLCFKLLLVVLAAVLLGPCHRVEAYISGAPSETCDTMLPQHQNLSAVAYSNCATLISFSLCLTPTIAGVSVAAEEFEYNCSQDYTITLSGHGSSQRGIMVEFRESNDSVSFDGSLSHVGEFGVASGFNTTTRLECQGHAVTQTVINTAGTTTFVWTAPQIGELEWPKSAQLWVTQVTSSQAFFTPRSVLIGNPIAGTCSCPENTYLEISVEQTAPVHRVSCRACPANSSSERSTRRFCPCLPGFGRKGLDMGLGSTHPSAINFTGPCVECFESSVTNLTVLSSQLPTVLISWTAPDDISEWEVLYRVTAGNTSTNVTLEEGTTMPMAALSNLSPGASYTLHVSAYTESGCLTPPASTAVTVLGTKDISADTSTCTGDSLLTVCVPAASGGLVAMVLVLLCALLTVVGCCVWCKKRRNRVPKSGHPSLSSIVWYEGLPDKSIGNDTTITEVGEGAAEDSTVFKNVGYFAKFGGAQPRTEDGGQQHEDWDVFKDDTDFILY